MADIRGYTLAQVRLFIREAQRRRREAVVDQATAARMAWAESSDWRRFVSEMTRG